MLSAIAQRDEGGNIVRSLAVSIDVTERKRAEEALRMAQEELSRYAQDLERQVRKRTREIASIFKYTPAVVYLKDATGHYLLVNPRFEELFGFSLKEVKARPTMSFSPRMWPTSCGSMIARSWPRSGPSRWRSRSIIKTGCAPTFR